jgi:hypothetical protein
MFNNRNNNDLQFNITLSYEAIVLEIFIEIFGMAYTYFPKFSMI